MKIAMCWKCSNVNSVKVEGENPLCSTMTGCKEMTQKQWDEAVNNNPEAPTPSWEDCPLSRMEVDL